MDDNQNKRAVIYCRAAPMSDAERSLSGQENVLRREATQRGYEVVGVVKENIGGAILDRSGIRELYALAEAGAMDMVLALSINHFVQNGLYMEVLHFVKKMASHNVSAVTLCEGDLCAALPKLAELI